MYTFRIVVTFEAAHDEPLQMLTILCHISIFFPHVLYMFHTG